MRWDFKRKKLKTTKSSEPVYRNPMFPKKTWQLFIIERFSIFALLILLIILIIVYIFFYSPIFLIKNIDITSTQNIPAQIIKENYVEWQMAQRRFLIFRQSNILLFSESWLRNNISQKFDPKSLTITKSLPHTLKIDIQEKTPSLIWITQEKYYLLEENGLASQEISKDNIPANLPKVSDESNAAVTVGREVITKDLTKLILDLKEKITEQTGIIITSFSVPTRQPVQINAIADKGFQIYFDPQSDIDSQIDKLKRIISEKLKDKLDSLQYIDLRIENRVYYK